ncbi:Protein kinase-like (PK-like) [Glarea lozoyensis ATCC 20868]|uniref:Protein kinase-like (PK-like) n=1 Tax=Glarea lozoyensis (strain ATCC 20868 / MF5171) TaxID=1116229 RepID=S3DKN0_GLAL2|nr:Protein kinase-like (PK-like) [Glarea lozoyensis ATCC 20868]EPE32611.1 Protein kinase-like (PK-like) [Glarea lozoyensis ATCC 20868]
MNFAGPVGGQPRTNSTLPSRPEPLDDCVIGNCAVIRPKCKQIGSTTEKWFENIAAKIRVGLSKIHKTKDPVVIEEELQKLKDNFPDPEPYVLCHGDLSFENIMVNEDNKITEIIDWEHPGYYPWWAERWAHRCLTLDGSDHLIEPLWSRLSPDMETEKYQSRVTDHVLPVIEVYEVCHVTYHNYGNWWLRPAFSKCEPWAGGFLMDAMGGEQGRIHQIDKHQ